MEIQIPMHLIGSPEMVKLLIAILKGRLDFDPMNDTLINEDGQEVKLDEPIGN